MARGAALASGGEAAVSEATLRAVGEKLRRTREIRIADDPVKSVEVLAQRHALTEGERSGVLRGLIAGGELTGYGLVNAVTRYAQQAEDYDRATELEALGGRLIEMPAREWKALAESA